jgi:UDP-glucuronate decarboxylase
MKRILVTGGAGFIGTNLCLRLLARGHEVVCLDDLSTGREDNVDRLRDHTSFSFVQHDVTVPINLEVDAIFHLACPGAPARHQTDSVKTVMANVVGTLNMLELARSRGATMVHASTSDIYGDPEVHPQPETYLGHVSCTGPRAYYDESKRVAETLCFDYQRRHGTAVRVARIFNTFGPFMRQDDGRVVGTFITQALKGLALTVYGEGRQTRSFCYIDDLIDGLIRLMATDVKDPVNLGNPNEFTILELAHLVLHATQSGSPIICCPLPQHDARQRRPDIRCAQQH